MVDVDDLVRAVRRVVGSPGCDPATHGLVRLEGGMSHDVFAPVDDAAVVAKAFTPETSDAASREWAALVALAGRGLAPEPVHLDRAGDPVVVMSRLAGVSLPVEALGTEHAERLAAAHRTVHGLVVDGAPPLHAGIWRARSTLLGHTPSEEVRGSEVVRRAWAEANEFLSAFDLGGLLSSDARLRFCRGDPNLRNYLWRDDGIALVDWEDSGGNDPALEIADMAEHASTRAAPEAFWTVLAEATGLEDDAEVRRIAAARRVMACFWLVIVEDRHRRGLPATVTLEDQAVRTLAVLGG